jgi:hypothetical protein
LAVSVAVNVPESQVFESDTVKVVGALPPPGGVTGFELNVKLSRGLFDVAERVTGVERLYALLLLTWTLFTAKVALVDDPATRVIEEGVDMVKSG